jgi:broad specificity phosphatase PhoE
MRYLVRHGVTDETNNDIFDGWGDTKLSKQGIQDAETAAKVLAAKSICRIFSSDIERAAQTAEILSRRLGVSLTFDPGLRPINVGRFTCQSKRANDLEFAKYLRDPNLVIPGGESQNGFRKRVKGTLAKYKLSIPVALVTHNSVFTIASDQPYLPDEDENQDIVGTGGICAMTHTDRIVAIHGATKDAE